MDKLPPIPTPAAQRWHAFRIQVLPMVMFAGVALSVALLWRNFVAATGIVGEVEAIKADVISIQDGTLARLDIDRFQVVEEGQELGEIAGSENKDVVEDAIKAKPAKIKAPISGVVTSIYHRPGEKVVRGVPILTVTAKHSDRIVGYLRQPINSRPTTNDTVVVRTRTQKRQQATGRILSVGTQLESINPALLATDSNRIEVGLPILVSIPDGMKLVPGEFVDLSIEPAKP